MNPNINYEGVLVVISEKGVENQNIYVGGMVVLVRIVLKLVNIFILNRMVDSDTV